MSEARIVVAEPAGFSAEAVRILQSTPAEVTLRHLDERELHDAFSQFDAVWMRLGHRVTGTLLPRPCRCRVLAIPATGLDHVDLEACSERSVQVISLKGEKRFLRDVRATAEHTLALALALMRKIPGAHQSVLMGAWDRDRFTGTELYGKVAGVIGVGRLGTIVAGYLSALGMKVIAHDPYRDLEELGIESATLDDLVGRADLITLHVELTRETHHLIDARVLALAKPTAILVNTSRGSVVDAEALALALLERRLAGAALDVLEDEPDIDGNPLLGVARTLDRVLITPHIGGKTFESVAKTEVFLAGKLRDYLRATEPRHASV